MTLQSTSSKGRGLPEGGKARRVYLHLHEEIMRGVYAAGALLPGEQKLAVTLDVSRVTVRRALDALEGDGLISRRAGSGTTVCAPKVQPALAADFNTLMPQLVEMGQNTTARLYPLAMVPRRAVWPPRWGWMRKRVYRLRCV